MFDQCLLAVVPIEIMSHRPAVLRRDAGDGGKLVRVCGGGVWRGDGHPTRSRCPCRDSKSREDETGRAESKANGCAQPSAPMAGGAIEMHNDLPVDAFESDS